MTLRIGEEEERGKGRVINWYEEKGRGGSQYPNHALFACIVQMCIRVSVTLSSSPLSPNFFLSLYLSHPSFLFILLCLPPPIFISILLHADESLSFNLFWSIYLSVDLFVFQSICIFILIHSSLLFDFIYPHILSSLNMYMSSSSFIIITDSNNIWFPTQHFP